MPETMPETPKRRDPTDSMASSWLGTALVKMQSLGSGFAPQSVAFEESGKEIVTTSLIADPSSVPHLAACFRPKL